MKKSIFLITFISFLSFVQAADTNISLPTSFGQALDSQLPLPDSIKFLARFVLGIQQSPEITASLLLVLGAIWVILFIIIANVLEVTPFFKGATRWVGATCITLIIAISGVIESIGLSIINFGRTVVFFENWSGGALLFALTVLVVSAIIIQYIQSRIQEHIKMMRAKDKGFREGIREARRKAKEDITDELTKKP